MVLRRAGTSRARQRHQRADDAGDGKAEQHFGKLQREQGRQIRPGHVRHRHQRAVEHFLPRLLEEVREIGQGPERIARLHDRPWPDQPHHEIAEDQAGQQHIDDVQEAPDRFTRALGADFLEQQRHEADQGIEQCKPAEDARADRQAGAETDDQDGPRRGRGIFLGQADKAEHQDHHRNRERRILRIHEHVPVEGRAQRQQQQRRKPGKRAADAPAKPPRHRKTDHADDGAEQAAGFKQFERDDLVQQCRGHVEAAAIHIEIGERQRAGILETGAIHAQQQVGIFGVGVVVPAQAVIAKRQASDQADRGQHNDGEVVASPLHRAPRGRIDGRSGDG